MVPSSGGACAGSTTGARLNALLAHALHRRQRNASSTRRCGAARGRLIGAVTTIAPTPGTSPVPNPTAPTGRVAIGQGLPQVGEPSPYGHAALDTGEHRPLPPAEPDRSPSPCPERRRLRVPRFAGDGSRLVGGGVEAWPAILGHGPGPGRTLAGGRGFVAPRPLQRPARPP